MADRCRHVKATGRATTRSRNIDVTCLKRHRTRDVPMHLNVLNTNLFISKFQKIRRKRILSKCKLGVYKHREINSQYTLFGLC